MEELIAYRQELLSALGDGIDITTRAEQEISPQDWYQQPPGSQHTLHFSLAYLRTIELLEFSVQIRRILDEELPLLSTFNDQDWMAGHYQPGEPIHHIVDEFTRSRQEELALLRSLPPDSWSRLARHPWWGLHSLQWWVELQRDSSHQVLGSFSTRLSI